MEVEFVLKRLISMEYMKLNSLIDKAAVIKTKTKTPTNTFFDLKAEKI